MRHKDKAALSVVIITRDEADMLPDCLQSIRWADEIVVYDSGSTDATIDIARCYTDKVYVDADWQGFGVQRRRAHEKASGDWILWVHADERVTPRLREEVRRVIAEQGARRRPNDGRGRAGTSARVRASGDGSVCLE